MREGVQATGNVPCKLCVPQWSSDFKTPLREVVRDVKATFSLRKNSHPSDFITGPALRACRLALAGGPQAVIAADPFRAEPL